MPLEGAFGHLGFRQRGEDRARCCGSSRLGVRWAGSHALRCWPSWPLPHLTFSPITTTTVSTELTSFWPWMQAPIMSMTARQDRTIPTATETKPTVSSALPERSRRRRWPPSLPHSSSRASRARASFVAPRRPARDPTAHRPLRPAVHLPAPPSPDCPRLVRNGTRAP